MKLKVGAEVFADTFNKYSDRVVRLSEDEDKILWHIDRCPICLGKAESFRVVIWQ